MKRENFERLKESVRQMKAIQRGELPPSRVFGATSRPDEPPSPQTTPQRHAQVAREALQEQEK